MRNYLSTILSVFFLLVLALPVPALSAPADSDSGAVSGDVPQDSLARDIAEAAALLEKNEAAKSYDLYMRLLRSAPDDDAVNLGLARAATRAKRWNQAVMAYETLLEKYPEEAGLYGELAQVYMLIGDREAAERSMAMVRALDSRMTLAETDKTLDLMESRYDDFQFHGNVRAGIQYDSNANLGPDSNQLNLGTWRVDLGNGKSTASLGAYLGADLELGKRFYRDSPWWLVADAKAQARVHASSSLHDLHGQEALWGRAAIGLRHLGTSSIAEARLKAEIFDYEFYQHVIACGPESTVVWAVASDLHLIGKAGLEWREYSRNRWRNGLFGFGGLYIRGFLGAGNHELLVGGRYFGAGAKERFFRYNGWEGTARLLLKLPYGFELAPFASFTQEYYKGPATILESKDRQDDRFRTGLGLVYRINDTWAIESAYHYTHNASSSALYTYDQHFMNLGIVWDF